LKRNYSIASCSVRTTKNCDACRSRKRGCRGSNPCNLCLSMGKQCAFTKSYKTSSGRIELTTLRLRNERRNTKVAMADDNTWQRSSIVLGSLAPNRELEGPVANSQHIRELDNRKCRYSRF
jgi:hypothetical protein